MFYLVVFCCIYNTPTGHLLVSTTPGVALKMLPDASCFLAALARLVVHFWYCAQLWTAQTEQTTANFRHPVVYKAWFTNLGICFFTNQWFRVPF